MYLAYHTNNGKSCWACRTTLSKTFCTPTNTTAQHNVVNRQPYQHVLSFSSSSSISVTILCSSFSPLSFSYLLPLLKFSRTGCCPGCTTIFLHACTSAHTTSE